MMSRRGFLALSAVLGFGARIRADVFGLNHWRLDQAEARHFRPVTGCGFLDQPLTCLDDCMRLPQVPYEPQPGDLMLSLNRSRVTKGGHFLAGAGLPTHSAMVVRRPDGSLGALEAGAYDISIIRVLDLVPHLSSYSNKRRVWMRTRATPLTDEQSARLTEGAMAQEGKRFALLRMLGQMTPIRSRGPVRTEWIGMPQGIDRYSYYCSELITELLVYAGLIDKATARPAATYPSDLFFDKSRNPVLARQFSLAPCWNPPARWRRHPVDGCDNNP